MNAPETKPDVFFSLNANYNVAPEATATNLLEDASVLLETSMELVRTLAFEIADDGHTRANPRSVSSILFGVANTLSMAKGAVDAANFRTERPDL